MSGRVILAIGDSTTAGTPDFYSPVEKPPKGSGDPQSQYAYWILKKYPEWTVLNRGVRGQRSDQIFWRFKRDLAALAFDTVIFLAGVNDIYQEYPEDHVIKNLREMYSLALEHNLRVAACSILPYNFSTPEAQRKIKKVNEWISQYAPPLGILFCDTHCLMQDPKNPGKLIDTEDGIHPNVKGYRKMGEYLARQIHSARR